MKKFIQFLDILRIAGVGFAFYQGYAIGFEGAYNPIAQLHFMIPVIIVSVAGLSGLEGLFFAKQAAEAKGFESGSNYQKQSAIALLSYAVMSLLVYFMKWGIHAELTILFTFLFFFVFSAVNHGVQAVKHKNFRWQNLNRPFLTLLLIAGLIYPVVKAFQLI